MESQFRLHGQAGNQEAGEFGVRPMGVMFESRILGPKNP